MGVCLVEIERSKLRAVELKLLLLKKIQRILFYGNQVLIHYQDGIRLGDLPGLAGILNVQQCQKKL